MPNRTASEQRLLRALAHAVRRNHEFDPTGCHGCREVGGFLTVPGYEGDVGYPACVAVVEDGPLGKLVRTRSHQAGLKFDGGGGSRF